MNTGFLRSLSHLGARIAESHRRSRTRAALKQLDDRQLADIGLHRSEISRVSIHGLHR